MTRPGFRRTSAGAGPTSPRSGEPPAVGAPFSQAQILHLMKTEFSRARRYGYSLACMLMKVERLPIIESAGSVAIREAARRELGRLVAEKTRDHDHLGLVEDDGYLLVLPHSGLRAAGKVAERIREGFGRIELAGGDDLARCSLSIGVSACEDRETLFFDTLLSQAELALEWAIEAGGDRSETFRRDHFVSTDADGEAPEQS